MTVEDTVLRERPPKSDNFTPFNATIGCELTSKSSLVFPHSVKFTYIFIVWVLQQHVDEQRSVVTSVLLLSTKCTSRFFSSLFVVFDTIVVTSEADFATPTTSVVHIINSEIRTNKSMNLHELLPIMLSLSRLVSWLMGTKLKLMEGMFDASS